MGHFLYTDSNNNTMCSKFCPSGWTESARLSVTLANGSTIVRDECSACPVNCSTCNGNLCMFCSAGFKYYEGACVDACPNGYYESLGVCKMCSVGCSSCSGSSSCQICQTGYTGIDGVCSPSCINDGANTANCSFTCDASCATCFGPASTQCSSCSSNKLSQGSCVSTCASGEYAATASECVRCPYGCKACNVDNCTSCISGFYFSSVDKKCYRTCPSGYFQEVVSTNPVCTACANGCKRCLSATVCLACDSGLSLFDLTCTQLQQNMYEWVNGTYRKCPPNCLTCKHKICTRCDSGWHLNQGECLAECPNSKYPKYVNIYDANGNSVGTHEVCLWKSPICETTATDGSGACDLCAFTFPASLLMSNSCYSNCPETSTKLPDLICLACPDNCLRCKPDQTCLKCLDNYVINHPSLLTSSNLITDSCLLNTCTTGFYSDSLQCQACQVGCDVCLLDGSCVTCSNFYQLDSATKTCYDTSCTLSQYYHHDNVCYNCAPECQTCNVAASTCTSCFSNPNNQTYLSVGTCVQTCPAGTFAHLQSKSCRKCDPRCASCSSHRNCTSCLNNFHLLTFYDNTNTPCVSECPVGFYVNDSNVCARCYHDCKSCYGPSEYQCLDCYPNFSLD